MHVIHTNFDDTLRIEGQASGRAGRQSVRQAVSSAECRGLSAEYRLTDSRSLWPLADLLCPVPVSCESKKKVMLYSCAVA